MIRSLALLVLVVGAGVSSCGGGDMASPTSSPTPIVPSTTNQVTVGDDFFSPTATTVPAGTTVTFTWNGKNSHNVAFDDGAKSATQVSGTYSRTLSAAGTYHYICEIHGQAMSGTITVQ